MLEIYRNIPIWGFEAIWRDDQVAGYIRRGEYAYSLGSFIGQG
jgi:sarcosine dehydrogenase